jgi:hypothetical protein
LANPCRFRAPRAPFLILTDIVGLGRDSEKSVFIPPQNVGFYPSSWNWHPGEVEWPVPFAAGVADLAGLRAGHRTLCPAWSMKFSRRCGVSLTHDDVVRLVAQVAVEGNRPHRPNRRIGDGPERGGAIGGLSEAARHHLYSSIGARTVILNRGSRRREFSFGRPR